MKIAILAQEEPAFIGPTLIDVIEKKSEEIEYVVLFGIREGAKKPIKVSKRIERFLTYIIIFGFLGSLKVLGRRGTYYLMKKSKRKGDFYSIKRACNRENIPVYEFLDMEDPEFKKLLKGIDLALNQTDCILNEEIIKTPRKGIINRHGSLLPKHRGRMASYWSHVEGKEYGITIHFLTGDTDSGDIVLQKKLNLLPTDSYYSILAKIFKGSSSVILEAFSLLENPLFKPRPMKRLNEKINGFPTLKEAIRHRRIFRKRK